MVCQTSNAQLSVVLDTEILPIPAIQAFPQRVYSRARRSYEAIRAGFRGAYFCFTCFTRQIFGPIIALILLYTVVCARPTCFGSSLGEDSARRRRYTNESTATGTHDITQEERTQTIAMAMPRRLEASYERRAVLLKPAVIGEKRVCYPSRSSDGIEAIKVPRRTSKECLRPEEHVAEDEHQTAPASKDYADDISVALAPFDARMQQLSGEASIELKLPNEISIDPVPSGSSEIPIPSKASSLPSVPQTNDGISQPTTNSVSRHGPGDVVQLLRGKETQRET
ncbi:hypothetical protein J1614_006148 [Plenodomus biglobosus]|nr:hypothetical protein J1614_006148 [Plenodomus biglobosus]